MQNVPLHLHQRQHQGTEIQDEHQQTVQLPDVQHRVRYSCHQMRLTNQAGHSIHSICVKGLWLLFTDNASDRKDMESHLIDKLGSRRPGGIMFTVLSF